MKLLVITLARNEEKIIPYFIHHYKDIADEIIVIDNGSSDNTIPLINKFCNDFKVKHRIFTLPNQKFDEHLALQIRSNFYKNFRNEFDVVIVCDCDEFWHHKNGTRSEIESLNKTKAPLVIKPKGYQMVHESFPEYKGKSIIEDIKYGARDIWFDKPVCFSINLNIIGTYGMHQANFEQKHNLITDSDFKLLHFKFMGIEHRIERIKNYFNNLSDLGKKMLESGINNQLRDSEEQLTSEFKKHYNARELLDL